MSLKIEMKMNTSKVLASMNKKRKRIPSGITSAMDEVGQETIRIAKTKVPVESGALQRSLDYIVKKLGGKWILQLGSGLTGGQRIRYALIQEEGGTTGRGHSVQIKPHWYMRNSIRVMKSKIASTFKRQLKRGIR